MQTDRSDKLVIVEVNWEQKPGNRWLLHQVFELLLGDPVESHAGRGADLTHGDRPPTMLLQTVADQGGEER